jgi:hypothetical protein
MGIVATGPNSEGRVEFVHATERGGVYISKMNILKPSDPPPNNDFIGINCQIKTDCLAGNLFAGYGTVRDPKSLK